MGKNPPKWLPGERVDETILLQRKTVEQLKADRMLKKKTEGAEAQRERAKKKLELKKAKKLSTRRFTTAQAILHTAEKRIKNARRFKKEGEKFETRRNARVESGIAAQTYKNARVAMVIRAKGNMIPQEVKAGYAKLGLKKLYQAKLILLTPEMHQLLLQLKRFAVVGYPTQDQLENLLRSRGSIWTSTTTGGTVRTYLTGNLIVENALAKDYNIYTIEELADAVFSKSKKVAEIMKKVAPFDLHPPRQMFFERNRSVHEKLEILNAESFASLLAANMDSKPVDKKSKKRTFGQKPAQSDASATAAVQKAKKKVASSKAVQAVTKQAGARRQRE